MLRGWTRRGRAEMEEELRLLTRHAEVLASQSRATASAGCAEQAYDFLGRARQILATPEAIAAVTGGELTLLHSLAVRQVAQAEREMHAKRAQGPVRVEEDA